MEGSAMNADRAKTKEQLAEDIEILRRRVAELELREAERKKLQTALREAEEGLRQARAQQESLIGSISALFISVDAQGRITNCNSEAERILDVAAGHALGKTLPECGVSGVSEIAGCIMECLKSGTPKRLDEIRFTTQAGKEVLIGLIVSPIRCKGNAVSGAVVLGRDITQIKAMQGQLARRQKLEAIGRLAAGIAHEINTPTQYVGDNTVFLRDSFSDLIGLLKKYRQLVSTAKTGPVPSELLEQVGTLEEKADIAYLAEEIPKAIEQSLEGIHRVADIVRAMKEFAHPGPDEKTPVDLNRAIQSTISVSRNEWKYVAEMRTELASDLPAVSCFPAEFNQAVLNLIVNAAHAIADVVGDGSKQKGLITIRSRRDGDWAEVCVEDTGPGIPPEIRSRIFEPFFTTKDVGKGTGQGLAVTHSIIAEKHEGTLTVETQVGKGARFIIRLPIA